MTKKRVPKFKESIVWILNRIRNFEPLMAEYYAKESLKTFEELFSESKPKDG